MMKNVIMLILFSFFVSSFAGAMVGEGLKFTNDSDFFIFVNFDEKTFAHEPQSQNEPYGYKVVAPKESIFFEPNLLRSTRIWIINSNQPNVTLFDTKLVDIKKIKEAIFVWSVLHPYAGLILKSGSDDEKGFNSIELEAARDHQEFIDYKTWKIERRPGHRK